MSQKPDSAVVARSGVERLAAWSLALRAEDVPRAAIRQAQLLTLDAIGCGVAALCDETARATIDFIREMGGSAQCVVIGSAERTSIQNAALANGVLVRTLDLNDYVVGPDGTVGGHPSDNIPVVLAAAELARASGRDALATIVLAYELYDRLKSSMPSRSAWDGVSVSGAVTSMATGRLLGLDTARMSHAIALGLSYSTVSATVRSGDISGAKSIANSLVAQHGARCALLARNGVTGPLSILDHPRGMRAVFSGLAESLPLDRPMPEASYVMSASVKTFPCLATGQSAAAAGIEMHKALAGDVSGVERIVAIMPDDPAIVAQQCDPVRLDPNSREAADHSFPFIIASSMLHGAFGLRQYDNNSWNDPQIRDLMRRIELTTSAELAARAPQRSFPCSLEVLVGGETKKTEVLTPPGLSSSGLEESVVLKKFTDLTDGRIRNSDRERLITEILRLDGAADCRQTLDCLRLAN